MEGGAAEFSECQRCQESSDCLVMELYAKHAAQQTRFTCRGFLRGVTLSTPVVPGFLGNLRAYRQAKLVRREILVLMNADKGPQFARLLIECIFPRVVNVKSPDIP